MANISAQEPNTGTFERNDIDPKTAITKAVSGLIRRYHVDGEILTWEQEKAWPDRFIFPDAIGKEITTPDPAPLDFEPPLIHRLGEHSVDKVIDSLSQSKPWEG